MGPGHVSPDCSRERTNFWLPRVGLDRSDPRPADGEGDDGDGVIELRRICQAVEASGYQGPIEVEIFNRDFWERAIGRRSVASDEGALLGIRVM